MLKSIGWAFFYSLYIRWSREKFVPLHPKSAQSVGVLCLVNNIYIIYN